ncbi:MAG: hypothetical protein H0U71_07025 [Gammaproteobacteria bacterium]|nr:hypothetical protein [Gammaproteobacteria bacterium]
MEKNHNEAKLLRIRYKRMGILRMGRRHLFEIEDQRWCPHVIRESITDCLLGLYNLLHMYEPAYQKIAELLHQTNTNSIIDCCSGSGGPVKQLRDYLDSNNLQHITITLTDKYPNLELYKRLEKSYDNRLIGHPSAIDACRLPPSLKGLRCFFSSFHHFGPAQAKNILQDAVDNEAPIALFECTQRHVSDILRAFLSPIMVWLVIPFARRLTWPKFLLTYVVPITPICFMWDYLISNLRTYSQKELMLMIKELDAPHYKWEVGKLWSKKAKSYIPYLVGYKH